MLKLVEGDGWTFVSEDTSGHDPITVYKKTVPPGTHVQSASGEALEPRPKWPTCATTIKTVGNESEVKPACATPTSGIFLREILDLPVEPQPLRLVFSRKHLARLLHPLVTKLCGQ